MMQITLFQSSFHSVKQAKMRVFIVVAFVLGAVSAAPRNGMLGNCAFMMCITIVFLTLFQPI